MRLGMRLTEISVDANGRTYGMGSTTTKPEPKPLAQSLSGLTTYKFGTWSTQLKHPQQVSSAVLVWKFIFVHSAHH